MWTLNEHTYYSVTLAISENWVVFNTMMSVEEIYKNEPILGIL